VRQRFLLFFIFALDIISSAELIVILTSVSPINANPSVYWTFYLSLLFCLTTNLGLLLYYFKKLVFRTSNINLWPSFRQTFLFSAIIVLALFLNSLALLSIWDITPLVIAAFLLELFFQADKNTPSTNHYVTE
jgi:hypothetical protein